MTVYVCVGPSGSGKTTYLAEHLAHAERITFDAIRRQSAPKGAVIASAKKKAKRLIADGKDVATDGCNLAAAHRTWWRNVAEKHGHDTHLVVVHPPDFNTLQARQADRGAEAIPPEVLAAQLEKWPSVLDALATEQWSRRTDVGGSPTLRGHKRTPRPRKGRSGNTTRDGYGHRHQLARKRALEEFRPGQPCVRCGRPLAAGARMDLDHTDDRSGYRGLAHRSCNRRAGTEKRNRIYGQ